MINKVNKARNKTKKEELKMVKRARVEIRHWNKIKKNCCNKNDEYSQEQKA